MDFHKAPQVHKIHIVPPLCTIIVRPLHTGPTKNFKRFGTCHDLYLYLFSETTMRPNRGSTTVRLEADLVARRHLRCRLICLRGRLGDGDGFHGLHSCGRRNRQLYRTRL
jgi:hypothetical protein